MCEPSFGMTIQGTIRNLGSSITRGRFFSLSCGVHPMKRSRGASFSRRGAEAEHGDGPAGAVVYGGAHLGTDQGLVVEAARRYIDRGVYLRRGWNRPAAAGQGGPTPAGILRRTGMTMDPQIEWVLDLIEKSPYPPVYTLSPPAARAQYDETAIRLDIDPAPMDSVVEIALGRDGRFVRTRLYTPKQTGAADPLLVWLHGGGWTIGSLDSYDRTCRGLAARADCRGAFGRLRAGSGASVPGGRRRCHVRVGDLAGPDVGLTASIRRASLSAATARVAIFPPCCAMKHATPDCPCLASSC